MFREMRRIRQMMPETDVQAILGRNTHGVLSVMSDEGYPYGVPVSYVYAHGKIWFHCAVEGQKIDAIKANPKVCFTIVDTDNIAPAQFTTLYRSVIAFGKAEIVTDLKEREMAFNAIMDKYSPDERIESRTKEMENGAPRALIVRITIDHLTGKQSKEYLH